MSFGGTGFSQSMQDAVHDAIAAGAIVVAAAGNLGIDAKGDSPAGLDGVITVGAVDRQRQHRGLLELRRRGGADGARRLARCAIR